MDWKSFFLSLGGLVIVALLAICVERFGIKDTLIGLVCVLMIPYTYLTFRK